MKNIILPIIGLLFLSFASEANAQIFVPNTFWGCNRSATVGESYLNGAANLAAAQGLYLQGLGSYQIQRQQAIGISIQNWEQRIRTRWEIQDEWKERNKTENFIQRKNRALDLAEQRHALKQREQDLIDRGILPPKKESGFYHKGKFFTSIEEWKESPEYAQMLKERKQRERKLALEKELKEQQLAKDMEELRKYQQDPDYFQKKRIRERVEKSLGEMRNRNLMDEAYQSEVAWLRKQGRISEADQLEKFRLRQLQLN